MSSTKSTLYVTVGRTKSCVANLAQGVVQRRLPLPVWGLDGSGGELFSRRKTLVARLDHQLPFLDHV
jgi:hypothetical protein